MAINIGTGRSCATVGRELARSAGLIGALLATTAAIPALAQSVANPGFETGDTTGWTTNGGYWYSGSYPPDPSEYSGPANLATIMTGGTTDPYTGDPTVFAGNYSLRLNDASGGNDITSLQQSVTNYAGNKLYYAWNAVLEPSHGATDSPSFLIKVVDKTTGQIVTNIGYSAFNAQNATGLFRQAGQFVTSDWKVEDVDMTPGHDYDLLFLAVDCLYGGHAGYVYVDGFGNAIPSNNSDVTFDPATGLTKGSLILIPIGGKPDIDTAQPFYTTTQLQAGSVNPNFVGGTLQADTTGSNATALTVQSQGGFIDTNGNDFELSGAITGSAGGALSKIGLGTLTLSGMTTLDNDFTVDGGVLNLPGTLSVLNTRVNSGGTLTGNGNVVSALIVGTGGTLAPGAGVGTLNVVGGPVTLGAGSTFATDIDGRTYAAGGGSGSYDRLIVTGGGFAAGGAIAPQLRGIAAPASNTFVPALGDRFTVVTADSVTGQFSSVTQPTGLGTNTRFDVFYHPKDVQLVVTPASFRVLGQSSGWKLNGIAAGAGLDAVRPAAGTRSGALQSLFNGLYGFGASGYQTALQQLSGEIHVHDMQMAAAASRQATSLASVAAATYFGVACDENATKAEDGKPVDCERNRPAIWARLLAQKTVGDEDATATRYESDLYGFVMGLHVVNTESTRIGFGGRYSDSKVKTRIGSHADLKAYSLFAYASKTVGPVSLTAVAGAGSASVDTVRTTTLTSGDTLSSASYDISSFDLSFEARGNLPLKGGGMLHPVVGISYDRTKANSANETNADTNLALFLPSKAWSTTQTKVGLEAEVPLGKVHARFGANWLHTLDGDPTASRQVFLGAANWTVASVGVKKDMAEINAGLSAQLSPRARIRIDYNGVRDGGNYKVDRGSVGLSIAF